MRACAPDIGVVVAYGQFLPRRIRELPRHGYLINAHASLLPRLRGAAPIARAILEGHERTGVSVMRVEREMDAGPVALAYECDIGAEETTGELEERIAALAARAVADALDRIASGTIRWRAQDDTAATFAPRLGDADAQLDWRRPALELARRVRACAPRPGARTTLDGEPLRILGARSVPEATSDAPGTVRGDDEGGLRIATGSGWLIPTRLQRAGARPLEPADFLRGRPIPAGTRLGAPKDPG